MRKVRADKGVGRDRWTVYSNYTDMPVMVNGTAKECAKAMGVTQRYFHRVCFLAKRGECRKWYVQKEDPDCEDD